MKLQKILRGSRKIFNEIGKASSIEFKYPKKGQETITTFCKADNRNDLLLRNEGRMVYTLFKIIED